MKNLFIIMSCLLLSTVIYSQEEKVFERKGRILVETGYNILGGFNSGTGISTISDQDGNSLSAIGFSGGYFATENLAIKLNIGILGGETSLTSLSFGGKYYIIGKIPVNAEFGYINTDGNETQYIGSFNLGYGLSLADNINLEPYFGALVTEGEAIFNPGVKFAMFL